MKLPLGNKDTLIGRASRALSLSFLSVAVLRFSTIGVGVLLARLLGPHAFGTYAVALVALLAVLSFNELGVSLAIVRWPGDPSEIAPTVATISCVSSVLLFIGFYLGAPAFADSMGASAATPVIRVLSISILVNCIAAVPAAMLQRDFRQGRKMIADQVHSWSFTGVAIGMAWAGFGAMSLAVASVIGALAGGILIMVFSHPPRFGFDPVKARALLKFGLPLAGSSFVVFLVGNVDNVIVGHMLGATALGFYVLAWNLSSWPVTMFSLPVRSVAPALFSRLQHDRAAMHVGFVTGVGLLASVALPVCLLMSGSAEPLVSFAYGSKWAPAAPVLVWLAGVGALRILFELSYDYFVVLARSRVVFTVQLAWLLALIPALIVAARVDGVRGAAIAGLAVAGGLVLPWYLIELHKVGIRVRALGTQIWLPLLSGAAVGVFAVALTRLLTNNLTVLLVSGVVTLGTIGLLVYYQLPDLQMLRSVFGTAGEQTAAAAAPGQQAAEQAAEPVRVNGREAEPVGLASPHERATGRPVEANDRAAAVRAWQSSATDNTVRFPAVQAWQSSATDDTVPFPALRERLRYEAVIDDAADVTAPLPIFRDMFTARVSGAGPGPDVPPPHRDESDRSAPPGREITARGSGTAPAPDVPPPHSGKRHRSATPVREISAIMRRHLVALFVVFIFTAGIAYEFKTTPPTYVESATVVFTAPTSTTFPNPYSAFSSDLITTAEVMVRTTMSPQSEQKIREAGGTANFNVALVNLYNEQFPDYNGSYATVTASATDPAMAHRTFTLVVSYLERLTAQRQVQAGVLPRNRISIGLAADTGPLIQPGSPKRTFAGLILLAIVAAFMLTIFLDRYEDRLYAILPWQPPKHAGIAIRRRATGTGRPNAHL